MSNNISAILEGLNNNRMVNESVPAKEIKVGMTLQLIDNMTIQSFIDRNGKHRDDLKDEKYRWKDDAIKAIEIASAKHMTISKSRTELKLTPGCILNVDGSFGKDTWSCNVGGNEDLRIYFSKRDYKKVDPYGAIPKEKKEKEEVQYAIYGCPDIYGRAGTQWHWTQKDDYESEKEFKAGVKYSAKRRAEQEYREYDPRSINTMYFTSKDAFLKQCNKLGFTPNLD